VTVVQQCREPNSFFPSCSLTYAVQLSQLCVWRVLPRTALRAALFGDFTGTMGESDFPWPFIIGLRVRPSRCGPLRDAVSQRPASGYPGSRAGGFHACERSPDHAGPDGARHVALSRVAFRFLDSVGTLDHQHFAAQYSARVFPCQRFAGALADADA
jgi:hypothetical protein